MKNHQFGNQSEKKMERYEKSGKMKDDWKKVFETTGNKENE